MIYYIGLIFAILLILISMDDVIWDIYYFVKKAFGGFEKDVIDFDDVEKTTPKMLAVLVAAYNEESVLEKVIENIIRSNQYSKEMFHVFLGVYPNDPETQKVADKLVGKFENVHKIVHILNGPSSKADNLNNMIKNLNVFERENYLEFASIIIHDSEDLIHPYEFKLENYLLEKHQVIQMPVFPLNRKTNIRNFYENIIAGTYADEFAENHYKLLVSRTETGAFVPSAGTGFVIRRDVLESFPDHNVFPVGSLTEDYKLSLQLKEKGFDVHYALKEIEKTVSEDRIAREFVAVRSMFPSSYRKAVKQKTRWIYGITMESFDLKTVLKSNNLNIQSKYSLYKDWKAKIGNLLLGPGYIIFLYFILSQFIDLAIIYPKGSLSWFLMVFLSIIMIERQILRFDSLKNVYGLSYAMVSLWTPPILPVKMVIGNIINFHATVNAWRTKFSSKRRKKKRKKIKWSKTDHEFLEEEILLRHRMNIGDLILYKGLLTKNELKKYYKEARIKNQSLEDYLLENKLIKECIMVNLICQVENKDYIEFKSDRYLNYFVKKYGEEEIKTLKAIPLIKVDNLLTVITTLDSDKQLIRERFKEDNIRFIYTSEDQLLGDFQYPELEKVFEERIKILGKYVEDGLISVKQGLIALNYNKKEEPIRETLSKMGLIKHIK